MFAAEIRLTTGNTMYVVVTAQMVDCLLALVGICSYVQRPFIACSRLPSVVCCFITLIYIPGSQVFAAEIRLTTHNTMYVVVTAQMVDCLLALVGIRGYVQRPFIACSRLLLVLLLCEVASIALC